MKNSNIILKSIKFHKVANGMESSSEKAPYLGIVDYTGTVDTEAFAGEVVNQGCTETKESVLRFIECRDQVVMGCVGDEQMRVYTGDGSLVSPFIYGSFDAPDAAVGPGNSVEPQIRLGGDLRDAVADIVPEEDRGDISTLGGVRVFNVTTVGYCHGVIKGTLPFAIIGNGFKPSEQSTVAVTLTNVKTGVTTAATGVTFVTSQRVNAHMPQALAEGTYKIVVSVTEGTGEAAKTSLSEPRNVTVLAADAPVLPKIKINGFTARHTDTGTLLNLGIENPEAIVGYTPGAEGPEGATVMGKLSINGGAAFDQEIVQGNEGEWGMIVGSEHPAAVGDTLKLVFERDPAKTAYDPTPAEATAVVGEM